MTAKTFSDTIETNLLLAREFYINYIKSIRLIILKHMDI